jgi:hypothetical protein
VYALAVLPDGTLIAGGDFTIAGGVPTNGIAKWDGSVWSSLGSGVSNDYFVYALAVLPTGDLVAGGDFALAGGVSVNQIARWNGTEWSPLGSGVNADVYSIAVCPDGSLVAGGLFTVAGGVPASRVARWTGAEWRGLGSGTNDEVSALAILANGSVVAGGKFGVAGGQPATRFEMFQNAPPQILVEPLANRVAIGDAAAFEVVATSPVSYRWRRNGAALADNSRLSGSAAALLRITTVELVDFGLYDCVVTNECGSETSATALLTCSADVSEDGAVDSDDVIMFFGLWDLGDSSGDINNDSGVDSDDVIRFFELWDLGC